MEKRIGATSPECPEWNACGSAARCVVREGIRDRKPHATTHSLAGGLQSAWERPTILVRQMGQEVRVMPLGRYQLLAPLGAGVDGVAYRAETGGAGRPREHVELRILSGAVADAE